MKPATAQPLQVPDAKKAEFKSLTAVPDIAWPTVILALVAVGLVISIDVLAILGKINLWVASALLVPVYYLYFSVIHDGVHRSISKNENINNFFGQLALASFAPYANLLVFRWAHMEHHRFTNDDGDPDIWCHGSWWTLPFRWMTIDFYYAFRLFKSDNPKVRQMLMKSLPQVILGIALLAGIVIAGYGLELLALWLIPTRLAFVGIGFSFFWLPHAHWPDDELNLKQSENLTIATTVRDEHRWLFTPLYAYQNFHLIHHLWPTTPFYNNEKIWNLLEPELRQRDLAIQKGFNIQPHFELNQTGGQS